MRGKDEAVWRGGVLVSLSPVAAQPHLTHLVEAITKGNDPPRLLKIGVFDPYTPATPTVDQQLATRSHVALKKATGVGASRQNLLLLLSGWRQMPTVGRFLPDCICPMAERTLLRSLRVTITVSVATKYGLMLGTVLTTSSLNNLLLTTWICR